MKDLVLNQSHLVELETCGSVLPGSLVVCSAWDFRSNPHIAMTLWWISIHLGVFY